MLVNWCIAAQEVLNKLRCLCRSWRCISVPWGWSPLCTWQRPPCWRPSRSWQSSRSPSWPTGSRWARLSSHQGWPSGHFTPSSRVSPQPVSIQSPASASAQGQAGQEGWELAGAEGHREGEVGGQEQKGPVGAMGELRVRRGRCSSCSKAGRGNYLFIFWFVCVWSAPIVTDFSTLLDFNHWNWVLRPLLRTAKLLVLFEKFEPSIPSIWFVFNSTISTNIHISSLEDQQVTSASLLWAKLLICWYYLKNIYILHQNFTKNLHLQNKIDKNLGKSTIYNIQ